MILARLKETSKDVDVHVFTFDSPIGSGTMQGMTLNTKKVGL